MCQIYNFIFLIYLVSGSLGYNLFIDKGPKYPPTKGQVWPAPQHESKSEAVYYVFQSSKFRFSVQNNSCDLLIDALERYNMVLRDLEMLSLNYLAQDVQRTKERQNYGILEELNVDLYSKCEDMPHYEMDEKYSLQVGKTSVLRSKSIWGILRGLETFVQLFYFLDDYSEIRINATIIFDYPRYKHRGLLIDTGRHFLSLSTIYKIIDALALNKMNVLHWHITDDQSFPYQSELYPTLSEKGAYYPLMVYTKADIRSVVAFARDRGIRVVAEIDVPGHTRSWGEAFPHLLTECYRFNKVVGLGPLDPTKNETYELLRQLFQEMHEWFPDEFLHVGGDEVQVGCWNSNPAIKKYLRENNLSVNQLQGYFMNRTLPLLPKQTRPIVWQEAFDTNALPKQKMHVQVWNYNWIVEMDKILKAGHYVIFSSSWYLDFHNQPWEEFYRADPRQMVYKMRNSTDGLEDIVGGEACMWGEMSDDTNILSKTWPRTTAIAERLWTGLDYKDSSDPATDAVRRRMEEHACRMNRRGIPAQPPNGPGFCIKSPPPLQKAYQVHRV